MQQIPQILQESVYPPDPSNHKVWTCLKTAFIPLVFMELI